MCTEIMDYLPVAVVVDNKVFCVHGGLSPDFKRLDDIKDIDRISEPPYYGAMCDLLWSDPEDGM